MAATAAAHPCVALHSPSATLRPLRPHSILVSASRVPSRTHPLTHPLSLRVRASADASGDSTATTTTTAAPTSEPAAATAGAAASVDTTAQAATAAAGEVGAPKKKSVIRRVVRKDKESPTGSSALDDGVVDPARGVEDGRVAWEGVAKVDRGDSLLSLGQLALLVVGDVAGLVLFSWIGRATHVSAAVDFELLKTAAPFIIGWVATSLALGSYSPSRPSPQGAGAVAADTAKTWAIGVPLGIALRSLGRGAMPQVPFAVVSMVTTFFIVGLWRFAFFSTVGKRADDSAPGSGSKSGNVFEFIELLTSLVRRW